MTRTSDCVRVCVVCLTCHDFVHLSCRRGHDEVCGDVELLLGSGAAAVAHGDSQDEQSVLSTMIPAALKRLSSWRHWATAGQSGTEDSSDSSRAERALCEQRIGADTVE